MCLGVTHLIRHLTTTTIDLFPATIIRHDSAQHFSTRFGCAMALESSVANEVFALLTGSSFTTCYSPTTTIGLMAANVTSITFGLGHAFTSVTLIANMLW